MNNLFEVYEARLNRETKIAKIYKILEDFIKTAPLGYMEKYGSMLILTFDLQEYFSAEEIEILESLSDITLDDGTITIKK